MNENIESKDGCGQTVRSFAAAGGNLAILRKFTNFQEEFTPYSLARRISSLDPMLYAIIFGNFDAVKYMWSKGFDFSKDEDFYKLRPYFHAACASGCVEIVKFIYKQYPKYKEFLNTIVFNKSCLMHAASIGSVDVVNFLIKINAKIDEIAPDGYTAIVHAARAGSLSCVKALVDAGATYNRSKRKYNCFIEAATQGHLDIVKYLIDKGININIMTSDGYTAVQCAAEAERYNVMKYLIMKGAKFDPSAKLISLFPFDLYEFVMKEAHPNATHYEVLHQAIKCLNIDLCRLILEKFVEFKEISEKDINWIFYDFRLLEMVYDTKGFLAQKDELNPLRYANSLKSIQLLESAGCQLTKEIILERKFLETIAINTKDKSLLVNLLEKLDNIEEIDKNMLFTNLINNYNGGSVSDEIVDILIRRFENHLNNFIPGSCNIFRFKYFEILFDSMEDDVKRNIFFYSKPFMRITEYSKYEYILENGYDATQVDNDGNCALHYLKSSKFETVDDCKKVIHLFTSHGCDINKTNNQGMKLLQVVNQINVFQALLECGADPNATYWDGITILHFKCGCPREISMNPRIEDECRTDSNLYAVKLLLDHGADPNRLTITKKPPLHFAVVFQPDIAIYLIQHGAMIDRFLGGKRGCLGYISEVSLGNKHTLKELKDIVSLRQYK
ncbi:hypothetical protein TVAG_228540 [Trichomonas vaginalis G3]|uniref:DUF3447 domain-containing protein n=1 Tax=Trichomonas vaginalis (strain ATCC PRA-98 / G3) TaxID=412133 RepID=A2DJ16_TRIV3|nr:protein ubiquitination [Trichomonas vaginalis G3]EAY19591.1 hypothetical protein TVAG_228540 [Trichomonas vaginalis G3]KAI5515922.1 protein ubiquitination [Trichomonas vaginalis G3]|eukprot:XP_001580577.1 hypothetical protein [Trichomonas vaginalis G3]